MSGSTPIPMKSGSADDADAPQRGSAQIVFCYAMCSFSVFARDHPELKLRATKRRRVNPAFGRVTPAKAPLTGRRF